jgi:hypothetical protein
MEGGHAPMNPWIKRHFVLNRHERWLIAGILAIALIGLAARLYRASGSAQDTRPAATTTP